jgi:hypothetical protein
MAALFVWWWNIAFEFGTITPSRLMSRAATENPREQPTGG